MEPQYPCFTRDVVVVGGSSGAFQALNFIADLPADFAATILLVVHVAANSPGLLARIIGQYSKIPVTNATNGEIIEPGRVYVAPPDFHLSILPERQLKVARGPKENRHRPSIDVLFRSAANAYGPRVIGVILSGMLDDGSLGLLEIRKRGGLGIVQDPKDAAFPDMPSNALACAGADHCVPHSRIAALLVNAVKENIDEQRRVSPAKEMKATRALMDFEDHNDKPQIPTDFVCPHCGGVLRQDENGSMLRFRCRVGHAYSGETLLAAQSEIVEQALWNALRLLEEKAEMTHKLKEYSLVKNFKYAPEKFEEQARKLQADAKIIRELLKSTDGSETE